MHRVIKYVRTYSQLTQTHTLKTKNAHIGQSLMHEILSHKRYGFLESEETDGIFHSGMLDLKKITRNTRKGYRIVSLNTDGYSASLTLCHVIRKLRFQR